MATPRADLPAAPGCRLLHDMRTWGTIPYIDVLAGRLLAAWAAWSRGAAGAGATARDSSRCRSSKYGSSSRVKKEYAMPDRPALSTELCQVGSYQPAPMDDMQTTSSENNRLATHQLGQRGLLGE